MCHLEFYNYVVYFSIKEKKIANILYVNEKIKIN